MANFDGSSGTKRQRMNVTLIKKGAVDEPFPWDDCAPKEIADWLDMYAKANNTTRDILVASILPTTACLMGNTKVNVACKLRAEHVNLFILCLSAPGSGKSPAFHNACSHPIRLHVEEQRSTQLFVDEFTEAGLFQQLKSSDGHKAIIGKEEVSQFFETLLSKEKSKLDVERLLQLYDGATWVYTKGNSKSRQVVDNPGVSIVGYSQPDRFFPLYARLKERKDGSVDRMMLYQPKPHRLTSKETKEHIEKLHNSEVKDLRMVYEDVYNFCHKEDEVLSLTLSEDGNKVYEEFVDEIARRLNEQWEDSSQPEESFSKADRHVIRLAAVLHIFYFHLHNRLKKNKASPPPLSIKVETLQQAIKLESYFASQRKVLDQLVITEEPTQRVHGKPGQGTLAKAILEAEGPFTTVRIIQQTKFNGKNRPSATLVIDAMQNLQADGLGVVKVVDRTTAFFKELPNSVTQAVVERYSSTKEIYNICFTQRAPASILSKDLYNKILSNAPKVQELKNTYYITEEI